MAEDGVPSGMKAADSRAWTVLAHRSSPRKGEHEQIVELMYSLCEDPLQALALLKQVKWRQHGSGSSRGGAFSPTFGGASSPYLSLGSPLSSADTDHMNEEELRLLVAQQQAEIVRLRALLAQAAVTASTSRTSDLGNGQYGAASQLEKKGDSGSVATADGSKGNFAAKGRLELDAEMDGSPVAHARKPTTIAARTDGAADKRGAEAALPSAFPLQADGLGSGVADARAVPAAPSSPSPASSSAQVRQRAIPMSPAVNSPSNPKVVPPSGTSIGNGKPEGPAAAPDVAAKPAKPSAPAPAPASNASAASDAAAVDKSTHAPPARTSKLPASTSSSPVRPEVSRTRTASHAPPSTQYTDSSSGDISERLQKFYTKNNPGKLASIPTILKTYAGRESLLLQKLESQYGVKVE